MAKPSLDRISMGYFEPEKNKDLEVRGEASFKLCYDSDIAYTPYYIVGKLTHGGIVSSETVQKTKRIRKDEFLEEVNENLAGINCYLGDAKYSKGFPLFGLPSVNGILYKEKTE